MATIILLIRHGETAWNRGKIFRGTHDIPLNENGRLQAKLLAKALESRRIDAAYSSPLSRARETADIILAPHGIEAVNHAGLTDFDYGQWTGLEDRVVAQKWPEEHACWLVAPHRAQPPGGDTLQMVFDRAFTMVEDLVQQHHDETVAIFAHRVVNKLLVLGMLTLAIERFPFIRQDNCCLNEFEWTEHGYIMISLNDTSHLRHGEIEVLKNDF
ncbi:phosphoglycerate mutase [Candidatus Vecturithrix granuli]|uniref:phosphoglycerate mutase (2,3-diphosphoglycerate-dependent) n=1 Tax=Vecturithrix granuli TaxID=1499967 RepID=A0A081C6M4_VECG1|nr:phosphoglycerate mutase [Candidatus Vecturithrix granuli]